jgi:hypothetical protein
MVTVSEPLAIVAELRPAAASRAELCGALGRPAV